MSDIYYPDFDNMKEQENIDSKSNHTENTISASDGELSEETDSEYEDNN